MKKTSFIALVFSGTIFVTSSVAAQSPVAIGGEGADVPETPAVTGDTAVPAAVSSVAVPTYHYNTLRTGWNNRETTLTPANTKPGTFGILKTVPLDEQVDAQPLIVPGQKIFGGTHDVVYVVTENNTVYAIDASSGAILKKRGLGLPVPSPLGCTANGPNAGITSTPVIDIAAQTLYVIAYVKGSPPIYKLHALNLGDLTSKPNSPVTVAASHKLTNGSTFPFDARYQKQRPALLELAGNIYAAFGSFCDFQASHSRGWLLGWNAKTLAPLPANQLTDTQKTAKTSYFLDSIWMSGYGIAGASGALYFSTGNSAPGTYDGKTNIQESVVKVGADLTHILDIYTPPTVTALDRTDFDLGSGGVLVLPAQLGPIPGLAVAGGKDGNLLLINRAKMGKLLDSHPLPICLCGPSFFTGPDGIGRVVSSHGGTLMTWQVQLSPAPHLVLDGTAENGGRPSGFFTAVSSNGTKAGTAIIWAVARITDPNTTFVTLNAFDAAAKQGTHQLLFSSPAGSWPNGGNPNIVPVVANGKVYVASNKALTIFGIRPAALSSEERDCCALQPSPIASLNAPHVISGTLIAVDGSTLTLQTRAGKSVKIDAFQAVQNQQVGTPLSPGVPVTVQGSSLSETGVLRADTIIRANDSSGEFWPPDR